MKLSKTIGLILVLIACFAFFFNSPQELSAQALRVLTGSQGGTGIGTATAGDVGDCLTVSDDAPFTYTLGPCGTGSGTADGVSNWLYNGSRLSPSTTVGIGVFASSTIGGGTGTTGLTINGTATSTNLKVTALTASRALFTGADKLLTTTGTSQYLIDSLSDETGTGIAVFATNPLLSGFRSNASSTIGGGTGATGLTINGTATTTNLKVTALTADRMIMTGADKLLTTSGASSVLLNTLTDETGTGVAVFSASPIFTGTAQFAGITVSASSTLGYASSTALTVANNAYLNTFTATAGTTTNATSTNLAVTTFKIGSDVITDITGTNLSVTNGILSAASTADGVSNWSYNGTRLTPTSTTAGLFVNASSTIGNGTATGGLTISGGATTTGNAYFGGNVGIGTTSPVKKLDVYGDIRASGLVQSLQNGGSDYLFTMDAANASGPRLQLGTISNLSGYFEVGAWGGVNNFDSKTRDLRLYTTGGALLSLSNTNTNVAIGTTTPWAKLSIQNSYGNTASLFDIATTTSSAFATSSIFRVNHDGKVGIGTTTPREKFEVFDGNNTFRFNDGSLGTTPYFSLSGTSVKSVALLTGTNGSTFTFDDSGWFGIFKDSKTNIDGGTSNGGSELFRITSSGNVGIGTTTPSRLLTVQGNGYFTNNVTAASSTFTNATSTTSFFSALGTFTNAVISTLLSVLNITITGLADIGAGVLEIPNGTAPTVDSVGELALDTTSNQLVLYGNEKKVIGNGNEYATFTYATTTAWTGTTTLPLGPAPLAQTWNSIRCFTDVGTLITQVGDGTNWTNANQSSTTVGVTNFTVNNTFTESEKRYFRIGTPASSPTTISCTTSFSITAD